MERLGEADHLKSAEVSRQLLGAQLQPVHIGDPSCCRLARCYRQHVSIRVDANHLFKPRSKQQCEIAGAAADVE
jgi:hypothetical protein